MAKGNLFLGMARGKVGDVVFYRMNGWQMTRVRNRNPKNPRTNEQLYQRAVISTTMKAYSMGKEIFDHSFQGQTIGEGCMRRFNSVNARILRSELINDIQKSVSLDNQVGRFCAPRSITGVPIIGLQVSEGTLGNELITPVERDGIYYFKLAPKIEGMEETMTYQDYFGYYGVNAGDIFTFVFMLSDLDDIIYTNPWYNNNLANQYNTKFAWIRLIVKDNLDTNIHTNGLILNNVFEIESGGDFNIRIGTGGNILYGEEIALTPGIINYAGVAAVIRSRFDMDLRSTAYTYPFHSKDFGIASQFILDTWIGEIEKVGTSELILEGGEEYGARTINNGINELSEPQITDAPVEESDTRRKGRTRA